MCLPLLGLSSSMSLWTAASATSNGSEATLASKQLFYITTPAEALQDAMGKMNRSLDVWDTSMLSSTTVKVNVYATPDEMESLRSLLGSHGSSSPADTEGMDVSLRSSGWSVQRDPRDMRALLVEDKADREACRREHKEYAEQVRKGSMRYIDTDFFDCWRDAKEVVGFFDTLTELNPDVVTKLPSIGRTIEDREIPAYKVAAPSSSTVAKRSIYVQSILHAREWSAGASTFYSMAALIDGLRRRESGIRKAFEDYDWYFVPIVNVDGYEYTWKADSVEGRLWRKNRRGAASSHGMGWEVYGVDLNRNFGPAKYFGQDENGVNPLSQIHHGESVLSEPESRAVWDFMATLPNLVGALDIHAYSALVLHPVGLKELAVPEPHKSKLRRLGDAVADAIMDGHNVKYESIQSIELYPAYGTFMDAVFLLKNSTPSLTFEVEGDSFIESRIMIRSIGERIFQGVVGFATALSSYHPPVTKLPQEDPASHPSEADETRRLVSITLLAFLTGAHVALS